MKVHVVVTDDHGNVFDGEATLGAVSAPSRSRPPARRKAQPPSRETLEFTLPARAFMKQHAKRLGGPAKFTLLLAWMTKGKAGDAKSSRDIEKAWNKMTELMGGKFNPAYTTRAKTNGWVDTPKRTGSYVLLERWAQALGKK
jgi:hypothetical protein